MTKIYRESFGYFLSSLLVLLLVAFFLEAMLWFLQPSSQMSVSFVALTFIAYGFHRHFLFGETLHLTKQTIARGAPPQKFGWFILVSGALVLIPVVVAVTLAFQYSSDRDTMLIVVLVAIMPVYLLTLSLFGTALPATVARDGTYRLSQGLRAGFQTFWRLVAGPGLVGAVLLAAAWSSNLGLGALGVTEDSLIILAYFTLLRTLGFLTTIFAVAVLCDMYQRTRPAPHHGQGAEISDQTPA